MLRERLALHDLARRAQVALTQLAQAAADDDDLRVEDVDEVGEAGAQVAPGPLDRRRSGRVAGVRRLLQQSRVRRGAPAGSFETISAASASRATPEASASRQPRRPQPQRRPCGSSCMWPTSPAPPEGPW